MNGVDGGTERADRCRRAEAIAHTHISKITGAITAGNWPVVVRLVADLPPITDRWVWAARDVEIGEQAYDLDRKSRA